jgi:hypothetical protein
MLEIYQMAESLLSTVSIFVIGGVMGYLVFMALQLPDDIGDL